ncbi:MAG: YraN family protein [Spirochaetaceae bacterium]|jgi:putative endonuclease|nr:YraN family protein [Spirochaetaceae bacterium]
MREARQTGSGGNGGTPREHSRSVRGREGEERAAAYLEAQGMTVIARNVRTRRGEVDLVALEGEVIVFAEVKTWSVYAAESLDRGIDARKQRRIIETAKYFLSINRKYSCMTVRFDVIFITGGEIIHYPSAFTENLW